MKLRAAAVFMAAVMAVSSFGVRVSAKEKSLYDPAHPVEITVWTYYNAAQLEAFNSLVDLFNETRGAELGIIVSSQSQGSVDDLKINAINAVTGKVGAEEVPNIFAAYADTAYEIDQMGYLVDLAEYLTPEQRAMYVDGYLEEGDFDGSGSMKIFPAAKSTEVFFLNTEDWQKFSDATGTSLAELTTMESLAAVAQRYYEWTDSLTEEPNDGRAFYGRDAMANYILIGAMQMGCEIFSVRDGEAEINFDRDVVRRLWDCYYVPYIKGYYAASGRFRSDDIKIGNIIACTGSSSSATFFPKKVTTEDSEYPITMTVLAAPQFEGSSGVAVQQGAGMVVTKRSEAEIAASVEFLLWFTQSERNIAFSVGSGYMPVMKNANTMEAIHAQQDDIDENMDKVLMAGVETVQNNRLYTNHAFRNGSEARSILEYCLSDRAAEDRAAVKQALQEGSSLEEAAAPFLTDEWFEEWYQQICGQLTELTG